MRDRSFGLGRTRATWRGSEGVKLGVETRTAAVAAALGRLDRWAPAARSARGWAPARRRQPPSR